MPISYVSACGGIEAATKVEAMRDRQSLENAVASSQIRFIFGCINTGILGASQESSIQENVDTQ